MSIDIHHGVDDNQDAYRQRVANLKTAANVIMRGVKRYISALGQSTIPAAEPTSRSAE